VESIVSSALQVLGLVRVSNEVVSITEATRAVLGLIQILNEVEAIVDSALSIKGIVRLVSEVVALSDNPIQVVTAVVVGAILGLKYGYFSIKAKVTGSAFSIGAKVKAKFKVNDGGESTV
jgi:ribosomal protein L30/L7E